MTEKVMNVNALPSYLISTLKTDKLKVSENNRVITIEPADNTNDCTVGLRGILSDYPEMSVDKFLERKHADKELDL